MHSIILYRPWFFHALQVTGSALLILWRFTQFKAILFELFEKCIQFTAWRYFIKVLHFDDTRFKASLSKYLGKMYKCQLTLNKNRKCYFNSESTYTAEIDVCCHIIWSIQLLCQWPFICIAFQNRASSVMLNFGSEVPCGLFNNQSEIFNEKFQKI